MFIGIDVQLARPFAFAVMNPRGRVVENGWFTAGEACRRLDALAAAYPGATVGIDAPRRPLPAPRRHYWTATGWRAGRATDAGRGRHCEVVVAACRLARPQWTPTLDGAPAWMRAGFDLFKHCAAAGLQAEEVFPTASYAQLDDDPDARLTLPLSHFRTGPKDMLDAIVAAFTVREYTAGHGSAAGGGDRLGTLVLPRPLRHPRLETLQAWPG